MDRLSKELTLFDVYAISTGAMFSVGFFLLPGIAASETGPSVILAYLVAALLCVPPLLSLAELCTAMPRSGGTYYFLDRSLGPLIGTVGGLGTWLALVSKTAFALVGMGAYLALFFDVHVTGVAVVAGTLFAALNVVGARETSGVQRLLVVALLSIILLFVVQGLASTGGSGADGRFVPFFTHGAEGFLATTGLVFVSFAGLLKVASVPEEVRDPDRNIPLGMVLSLVTVAVLYGFGLYVIVTVVEPARLYRDLTPVATAGEVVLGWLPGRLGVGVIVAAAVAAFAAMSNAGIMSASRYPLAMARDELIPGRFAAVTARGTPGAAILITTVGLILFLLAFDVEAIAELASSFLLLVFGLVNLAVVVMRESRLEAYDPGFRSPLYPWVQIVGLLAPFLLIAEMGLMPIVFTLGVVGTGLGWYFAYARNRVRRDGALFHWFERLGRRRFHGLDSELRQILKEKGLRAEDPFDEVVTRASVVDVPEAREFGTLIEEASRRLAPLVSVDASELAEGFAEGTRLGATPVAHGVALPHLRLPGPERSHLVLSRAGGGVRVEDREDPIRAAFFLISPASDPGRHLRILAQLAQRADDESFLEQWLSARNEQELKEAVLHDERFLSVRLRGDDATLELIGRTLGAVRMPRGTLVAIIRREGEILIPDGATVLREGDRLTVVGQPEGIARLAERLGREPAEAAAP